MRAAGVLLAVLAVSAGVLSRPITVHEDVMSRARRLVADNFLIDGHNDLPWQLLIQYRNQLDNVDLYAPQPSLHTDIPRLIEGGVGGQFWSVYVPCNTNYNAWSDHVRQTMDQIDVTKRFVAQYSDTFQIAYTAADVRAAYANGRIASLMGMEGGHSIDNSLATLRMMYDLGARYMTLTHNCHTSWVDSSTLEGEHNGLTDFGRSVVLEMNRIGMFVDISHVSAKAMHDVLDVARAPIIFSHSSAFSVCDHARNVPDDVLVRVAENGGVVMVNFATKFVCCVESNANCTSADLADHIDHIRDVAGIDYIGLGADYDGVTSLPKDLGDVSTYPVLVAELLRRNYSDEDIGKILGGNVLRALEGAEDVARQMQSEGDADNTLQPTIHDCPGAGDH